MHRFGKILCFFAISLCFAVFSMEDAKAQRFAVSTNVLELAMLSPNLSLDMAFAQHHSLSFSASAAPWQSASETYLKHFSWSPEYKYWLTMPFYKSYIGAKLFYSSYDLNTKQNTYKGNVAALLADYGYSFILSKRWNITPTIAAGAGYNVAEVNKIVPVVSLGVNIQIVVK